MCKLTKTLLVWLLMLAIPMQGFAATAMLFCAPGHHNTAARISSPPMFDHQAALPTQAKHQHGNQVQKDAAVQAGDLSIDHCAAEKMTHATDSKCSACAACCAGPVIVSTQSFEQIATMGTERIPFIQASFVNCIPKELDPPPKSHFA